MYSLSFLLLYEMKYASIKYIFDKTKNAMNAMELKQKSSEKRALLTLRDLELFVAFPIQRNIRTS